MSDNSVQTDKGVDSDTSDGEGENLNEKMNVTPITLEGNLIEQKQKSTKNLSTKKSKKSLEKSSKVGGKLSTGCNPTYDFSTKISFSPSKLQKKVNPNDSKLVDSTNAIRKFK